MGSDGVIQPVAKDPEAAPSFADLLKQGHHFLGGLEALETQVAGQLADRHAEVGQLRDRIQIVLKQLADLRETERQWSVDRDRLNAEIARTREELEAARGQLTQAAGQAEEERQALQQKYEEYERELGARLSAREASLEQARAEAGELQAQLETLQADQLQWATDRQGMIAEHDRLRSAHDALTKQLGALAGEHAQVQAAREQLQHAHQELQDAHVALQATAADRLKAALAEAARLQDGLLDERSALEARVAELQRQRQQSGAELESHRQRLAASLEQAEKRIAELQESERVRAEEYEALSRTHAGLIAQASKQTSEAKAKREALVTEIQQLNQELTQALNALARSQERERQREKALADFKQTWQTEKTDLEVRIRQLTEAAGAAAISPEQVHAINSHLNAITGFSQIVLLEGPKGITPEERQEYLRLIAQSASRLVDEVGGIASSSTEEGFPEAPTLAPPAATAHGRPAILIADADPATRERVEPFLSRAGYDVIVAAQAEEALATAGELQPIAVIVDVSLPPRGAAGLVSDLRRDARTRDIPIVLTSVDGRLPAGVDIAGSHVLAKPIDRQQLLQVMVKLDLLADQDRGRKMPSTVLLVDDDPQQVQLLKAMLKPYPTKLVTAQTGAQAIELARSHRPDLLVIDLMMPQGDGFEIIDALRAAPDTQQLPIVVYTAKRLAKQDLARLSGRVQAVILKGDFNRERLLELIHKRGERRSRASGAPRSGKTAA
jgi:CheY-like chemotaxis protein